MPLVQKRKKLNDFLYREGTHYGNDPVEFARRLESASLFRCLASSIGGCFWSDQAFGHNRHVYVYHIEKHRPRWIQVNRNKIIAGRRTTVSECKNMKWWAVRLFRIPYDQVKHVEQHARHFTLELK